MRVAGDCSPFSFEPRGLVAFGGADRRESSVSVMVRGGGSRVEGREGENIPRDQPF